MRKLRIDISGPRGSGKTTIAALIRQALAAYKIEFVSIDDPYVEMVSCLLILQVFIRRGKKELELSSLAKAMRKAKSRKAKKRRGLLHHSLDRQRLGRETWGLEKAFADAWERENKRKPGINFGCGVLQDLMVRVRGLSLRVPFEINQREAVIVATVIQWFGTNCGFAFLDNTLRKCRYKIIRIPPEPKKAKEKIGKRVIRFSKRR